MPYDPIKDFDPVTLAVSTTTVLAVHPSVPAQTVRELVALIRANPGKYSYASPGTGTPGHLVGELFRLSLGLDLVHVPFNSAGLAVGSTVAGHTPICFASPSPAAPHVNDGKLRAPRGHEQGAGRRRCRTCPPRRRPAIRMSRATTGRASSVPAGTPKEIIAFLHREIVKIMALPDIKERLAVLGFEPVASTPEEFAARIKVEFEKWAQGDPGIQHQGGVTREFRSFPIIIACKFDFLGTSNSKKPHEIS